jgi:hypothetical protein
MTLTTISAGADTSFSTKLNANFKNAYSRPVASTPYTGGDFDTIYGSPGAHSKTFTVAAGDVSDYVRVIIHQGGSVLLNASGSTGGIYIKIETAVAGSGSWTTRYDTLVRGLFVGIGGGPGHTQGSDVVDFYYAPTASEKSTGLDIRITGTSTASGTSFVSSGNIQTVIYGN